MGIFDDLLAYLAEEDALQCRVGQYAFPGMGTFGDSLPYLVRRFRLGREVLVNLLLLFEDLAVVAGRIRGEGAAGAHILESGALVAAELARNPYQYLHVHIALRTEVTAVHGRKTLSADLHYGAGLGTRVHFQTV